MSDTKAKLLDAKTQLDLAIKNFNQYPTLRSCINSFISSARSVTFVMQKEFSKSKLFKEWYANKQKEMKNDPMLKFFGDIRTISIHQRSIEPNQRDIDIQHIKVANRIVSTGGTVTTYEFEDYDNFVPGDNGNVIRVCKQYYSYLESLYQEWLNFMK